MSGEHWTHRLAQRFRPTVPSLPDWAAAYPVELADLIDAAHGRPRRTVEQRYTDYAARAADLDQVSSQARLVAQQVRKNAVLLSALAVEQAQRPEPEPEPELQHMLPILAPMPRRQPPAPPPGQFSYV